MKPVDVRSELVDALRLDLVGPENGSELEGEILSQAPSRWYLTGFLVPLEAGEAQKSDEAADDTLDAPAGGGDAADDDNTPEPAAARRAFFPSSVGLSLLVSRQTRQLQVEVNWGDYRAEPLTRLSDIQPTADSLWSRRRMHSGEGVFSPDSPKTSYSHICKRNAPSMSVNVGVILWGYHGRSRST